jgi:hypothetical protein
MSEMEDLCFPEDCILEPGRDLASFVGNGDEAHPELSSSQAFVISLREKHANKKEKHHKKLSNSNQEKNEHFIN